MGASTKVPTAQEIVQKGEWKDYMSQIIREFCETVFPSKSEAMSINSHKHDNENMS